MSTGQQLNPSISRNYSTNKTQLNSTFGLEKLNIRCDLRCKGILEYKHRDIRCFA